MPYITYEDVEAAIEKDVWIQIFDRDEDGSVNTDDGSTDRLFIDAKIDIAQSIVDTELEVAYPQGLLANGGTVDRIVKDSMVLVVLYEAIRHSPLAGGTTASIFRQGYDDAVSRLRAFRRGAGARLITGAGGVAPGHRTGEIAGSVTGTGATSLPYQRAANRKDHSDF